MTTPYYADDRATLYGGDALAVLASLPTASVDAVITDPPYSSGGMMRGDRANSVDAKYVVSYGRHDLADFTGDNRDQRGYGFWVALWLGECLRVVKPGGVAALFTDWRQLPVTTDAIQAGGFVWRGIVPWHKPSGRPIQGRYANSCEYVVWGTSGPRGLDALGGHSLPGFFQANSPRDRDHMTQKPLSVMRELMKITPEGGTVLDPFMGSGTTGVGAVIEGRNFIGVELSSRYQQVARERIVAAQVGYRDDGAQLPLLDLLEAVTA